MIEQELKGLQTQLTKVEGEIKALKQEQAALSEKQATASNQRRSLLSRITELKQDGEPIVSEHAILRYIERIMGVDVDRIKTTILSPKIVEYINTFRSGTFPCDGFKVVVKDRCVVTIKE